MPGKPLWKDIFISEGWKFNALRSYYESCRGAWGQYIFEFHQGLGTIETNLPYSELRRWFRYALDEPIPDHVTSKLPTWELYNDPTRSD